MVTQTNPKILTSQFFYLRDRIEKEIAASIVFFGEKTKLRDACEYALFSGGKRLRPIIVMMVAEALGHGLNVAPSALCVEFFHTASLIADDLPCMDNEEERRNKPTVHKVYGESIALLASYTLICSAFEKIYQNTLFLKEAPAPFSNHADLVCTYALEIAARCGGILGATGGQFLDLYPPNQSIETVREIIYKKTITLFEGAFVLGWLFGGGAIEQIHLVKKAAYRIGMAFQVADDLDDLAQDENNQRSINIAKVLGKERTVHLFYQEMKGFKQQLEDLELFTPSFEKMCDLLQQSVSVHAHKL